ncbi:MAG TPA: hypothetical protein VLA19_26570 [Herpetosiphonaceae bacterium]|nr:hypothetical protein [Herpetosiphonaceae bacterium]
MVDIATTSVAVVSAIAPFMPYLKQVGAVVGDKLSEAIDKHGGDVAWQLAQRIWGKLKDHFGADAEVEANATLVATKPENEGYLKNLTNVLAERLAKDSSLAEELSKELGGTNGVNRIAVGRNAWIAEVEQYLATIGVNEIKAGDDAVIIGVSQRIGENPRQ